jgi:hypothetical protein
MAGEWVFIVTNKHNVASYLILAVTPDWQELWDTLP